MPRQCHTVKLKYFNKCLNKYLVYNLHETNCLLCYIVMFYHIGYVICEIKLKVICNLGLCVKYV